MSFTYLQCQDNFIVDEYINSSRLKNLSINKQIAILVSALIRKDLKTNKDNFILILTERFKTIMLLFMFMLSFYIIFLMCELKSIKGLR